MLNGVCEATKKMAPRATTTADPPTTIGTPAARPAEDEQQRERGERQRDQLGPLQVALGEHLDVAVERRAAGQERSHARGRSERGSDRLERLGRLVGRRSSETTS